MKADRNQLAEGTAWITPEGVLFQGEYYSCRKALRDGWYGKAVKEGAWTVDICFDSAAEHHEVIYIDSEQFMPEHCCYLLNRRLKPEPEYASAYQQKLRQLQERRKLFIE